MRQIMRLTATACAWLALTACHGGGVAHDAGGAITEVDCPASIVDHVRLSGSAVPLSIPAALVANDRSTDHPSEVARRLTLAVAPQGEARGLIVFASTLSLTTAGGTLEGWAHLGERFASSNALDIIPGRLRIEPFLRASRLEPQTMVVDVLVVPGAAPIDELAIKPSALWDREMHAVQPHGVQIELTPVRHFNVFDEVSGNLTLQLTAARAPRADQRWTCSFEDRFELVDHEAVLPDLWGLRVTGQRGAEDQWLALADSASGPFRGIFTDAQTAHSFASWLQATRTPEVAGYEVGLFQLKPDENTPPAARRIPITPFHALTAEELESLEVKRLGE